MSTADTPMSATRRRYRSQVGRACEQKPMTEGCAGKNGTGVRAPSQPHMDCTADRVRLINNVRYEKSFLRPHRYPRYARTNVRVRYER